MQKCINEMKNGSKKKKETQGQFKQKDNKTNVPDRSLQGNELMHHHFSAALCFFHRSMLNHKFSKFLKYEEIGRYDCIFTTVQNKENHSVKKIVSKPGF